MRFTKKVCRGHFFSNSLLGIAYANRLKLRDRSSWILAWEGFDIEKVERVCCAIMDDVGLPNSFIFPNDKMLTVLSDSFDDDLGYVEVNVALDEIMYVDYEYFANLTRKSKFKELFLTTWVEPEYPCHVSLLQKMRVALCQFAMHHRNGVVVSVLLLWGVCCFLLLPFPLFGLSSSLNMMAREVVIALMPLIVVSGTYTIIELFSGGIGEGKISQSAVAREGVAIVWASTMVSAQFHLLPFNKILFTFITLLLWTPLIHLLRSKIVCMAWMSLLLFPLPFLGGDLLIMIVILSGLWIWVAPAVYEAMGLKKLHIVRFDNWLFRYFMAGWLLAYLIVWSESSLEALVSAILLIFAVSARCGHTVDNPFHMPVRMLFGSAIVVMSLMVMMGGLQAIGGELSFFLGISIVIPLYLRWAFKSVWYALVSSLPLCAVAFVSWGVSIYTVMGVLGVGLFVLKFVQEKGIQLKKSLER